ncbi:hypothetical protein [Tsukamurella soli]|uniref:hypothetical protein n=1 Tax=Tsukamurella soli TaxID=644556 RepID=UPI0031E6F6AE
MTNSNSGTAAELKKQMDALLALAEGKFEYIRTLQGDVLQNLDDLTLVVNAHGAVLGKAVSTGAAVSVTVQELVRAQESTVEALGTVGHAVRQLAERVERLEHELRLRPGAS